MPQFFCFYKRVYQNTGAITNVREVTRPFYSHPLPEYVKCFRRLTYKLIKDKPVFWRTYNQSETNGESFYYQQIVLNLPIFGTTYKNEMERFGSYKGTSFFLYFFQKKKEAKQAYFSKIVDYYEHLLNEGSIESHRRVNIESLDDIVDVERGLEIYRDELAIMLNMANQNQKSIFSQIVTELELNSTAIVSGAAGTGKSYLLRMLERHYRLQNCKVKINATPSIKCIVIQYILTVLSKKGFQIGTNRCCCS